FDARPVRAPIEDRLTSPWLGRHCELTGEGVTVLRMGRRIHPAPAVHETRDRLALSRPCECEPVPKDGVAGVRSGLDRPGAGAQTLPDPNGHRYEFIS